MSILVGVDDSAQSTAAVDWAAREAALRDTRLMVLHAFPWPIGVDPRRAGLWEAATAMVTEAGRRAAKIAPDVSTELVTDGPAHALVQRSAGVELVVTGTRGHGGFHGLLIGSVALQVAGHASCPVALVGPSRGSVTGPKRSPGGPDAAQRSGPADIVVGIGGQAADEALAAAFAEAALRGVRLRALHAWRPLSAVTPATMTPLLSTVAQIERREEHRVVTALAPWRRRYPQVPVLINVVCAAPRRALVDASAEAALLVVAARERHDTLGPALGSVAHAVASHATCPVLIAR